MFVWLLVFRFLFFLMQKDPLIEFAARPLPADELTIGVPEQARSVVPSKRGLCPEQAKSFFVPSKQSLSLSRASEAFV